MKRLDGDRRRYAALEYSNLRLLMRIVCIYLGACYRSSGKELRRCQEMTCSTPWQAIKLSIKLPRESGMVYNVKAATCEPRNGNPIPEGEVGNTIDGIAF